MLSPSVLLLAVVFTVAGLCGHRSVCDGLDSVIVQSLLVKATRGN